MFPIRQHTSRRLSQTGQNSRSDELATVNTDTGPLANNLGREDEVLEDLLVDGGQCSGSGSLLAELLLSGFLSEHSSLGNEDDVSVRELLLEFSGKSVGGMISPGFLASRR